MTITIRADGSIFPSFSPISTTDNITYFVTDDIACDKVGIAIERSNITLEGNGHTLLGMANGTGLVLVYVRNVTVKNLVIADFDFGLILGYSSENTVSGNNVTSRLVSISLTYSFYNNLSGNSFSENSEYGIGLWYSSGNILCYNRVVDNHGGVLMLFSLNNTWIGNNFISNIDCIRLENSFNNSFLRNNFLNNKWQIDNFLEWANTWDNGSKGNYWSDYKGADHDHDGIGDTPYTLDANNTDHYPLMAPYVIPEKV